MSACFFAPRYTVPKLKKGEKRKESTAKIPSGSRNVGWGCYHTPKAFHYDS